MLVEYTLTTTFTVFQIVLETICLLKFKIPRESILGVFLSKWLL